MAHELKDVVAMSAEAFVPVMEQYGEDVWNYLYMLTRSRELADDLAQETFIRAYRHLHSYRGEAAVKTWLLRIARNRWYSYRRLAFVRRVTLTDRLPETNASDSAEEEFLRAELTSEVWRTVLELPVKYREILMLRAHYEMSMEELAEALGITVSAAKSRLQRARRKAAELWGEERSEA
ncbi:sigma-70 family RNA polymerase sigma factor [Saccharibacillus sp. CPCC 101409]|uniref:RNA polymerase sigma factor n=1 Tax=Saccharibacillus sp. CPCC 101409 TaxID=3058041 RepID=UPI0026733A0C|nr:sigma-70 family RNA polymerase sigma factor [Saccharibacillus sp. CPCC 101409]MDO3410063.1 sigma-70 family RNA polymerase sigma factor [Saccharibacillus sp. CPCC 101409]